MAEARYFHSYSHVFENLENRTIPSDHAAVRVVIQESTTRGHMSKRIPSRMSKHSIFCSLLQQLDDDHRFTTDPFCALAEFVLRENVKKQTIRERSRKTPDTVSDRNLNRSYCFACLQKYTFWDTHAMLWGMEAYWRLLWSEFFECVDFQSLSQIIANLTRENRAEREAEITNLPATQTEKGTAVARCRIGQRAWRIKKPVLCLSAVTDEDGHPLENEDESGRRLCEYQGTIFQARA